MKHKGKAKRDLAEKVQAKLDAVRAGDADSGDTLVGVETTRQLEKLLENHLLARARTRSAKSELEAAKANEHVADIELREAYAVLKKQLKKKKKILKSAKTAKN